MLLRIIYIVVLWVFVDQVFLDSEGLYQIPDLTALDTRHNIFISGLFSNSRTIEDLTYGKVELRVFSFSSLIKPTYDLF